MNKYLVSKNDVSLRFRAEDCNIGWFIADAYLEGLKSNTDELFDDPEYKKCFDALRHYVNLMLYGGDEFNMASIKVTVYKDANDAGDKSKQ